MKKFLSLVLALVMTMSLVTVSAGAKDFTDDSKITYAEAVDVMSAVKVIDGYEDGSFQPSTNLTRGAAAKIICNLILGPTTAAALGADTAPYSDVPVSNVFSGYIAYCQKEGIISGYADGTFRPSAPLTGYAFLKMLLGALGYDSVQEGYTGANWSINVAKQAIALGLTKGNDEFVGQQTVNREEAMLYAFNTMKATMVEYGDKTTVTVNGATIVTQGEAQEVSWGTARGNDGNIKADGYVQFAEKYFPDLSKTRNNTDAFGRPAAEWKYKSTTIGTYADDTDLVETYTDGPSKGELYNVVGSSTVKNLGTGKDDYSLTVWMDGKVIADGDDKGVFFEKNASGGFTLNGVDVGGKGALVEVYMDDDNNVTIVIVNTYLVKATADYNEKKGTLSIEPVTMNSDKDAKVPTMPGMPTYIDNDSVNVEEFKEDDYILVTYSYDTKGIESAVKAESLTGAVSEYTYSKNVVIDGTKYAYNYLVGSGTEHEKGVDYTIGENAVVIMDAYGYIIYVDEALSTSSYVYIQDAANPNGLQKSVVAGAYFADGTYEEISLKKVDGETPTTNVDGHWYTFSKGSDGKYTLYSIKLSDEDSVNGTVSTNGKVTFLNANSGVKGNSSTIMVVLDSDYDVSVFTGVANMPTITSTKAVPVAYVTDADGYAKYVFVDLSSDEDADVEDYTNVADYMFVLKATGNKTVSGEDTFYQYNVIIDGKEETVYVEATVDSAIKVENAKAQDGVLFYNIQKNAKDYITKGTVFDSKNKATQEVIDLTDGNKSTITYSNGTLALGDKEYIIAEDCSINLVVGPNATELLKDPDADYETYIGISANALAGYVNGYALTGTAYAEVKDEKTEQILKTLYVYVTGADDGEGPVVDVNADDFDISDSRGTITVLAYGKPSDEEVVAAVIEWLETVKDETVDSYKWDGNAVTFDCGKTSYKLDMDSDYTDGGVKVQVNGKDMLVAAGNIDTLGDGSYALVSGSKTPGDNGFKEASSTALKDGLAYELGYETLAVSASVEEGDNHSNFTGANLKTAKADEEQEYVKSGDTVEITVKAETTAVTGEGVTLTADGTSTAGCTATVTDGSVMPAMEANGTHTVTVKVTDVESAVTIQLKGVDKAA